MFDKEFKTAVSAANRAGRLLKAMSSGDLRVEYKGEIDLVTRADRAAENMVVKLLRKSFPGDDILTEETSLHRTGSPRRWIIDPLDGTTNYAHGFPFWCVSLAFEFQGRVELGAICNPNLKELFTARKGQGA
jgi:myo-inositol-1(or 4)-monophosphatase